MDISLCGDSLPKEGESGLWLVCAAKNNISKECLWSLVVGSSRKYRPQERCSVFWDSMDTMSVMRRFELLNYFEQCHLTFAVTKMICSFVFLRRWWVHGNRFEQKLETLFLKLILVSKLSDFVRMIFFISEMNNSTFFGLTEEFSQVKAGMF